MYVYATKYVDQLMFNTIFTVKSTAGNEYILHLLKSYNNTIVIISFACEQQVCSTGRYCWSKQLKQNCSKMVE